MQLKSLLRAEQRLRPRCPTELRRPRGAEEARPRPPCGGMAAAPRCGEWRRPGAVPLKLLALLALAGAAGAGQLSKWRVPVPMVSAGTAGRLRGREAPGALLARRGTHSVSLAYLSVHCAPGWVYFWVMFLYDD